MTVKELKLMLESLPDDANIFLDHPQSDYLYSCLNAKIGFVKKTKNGIVENFDYSLELQTADESNLKAIIFYL